MKRSDMMRALGLLAEVYRREDVTEATAEAWYVMLGAESISVDDFIDAAIEHSRTEKFFPAPSDLMNRIRPKLPTAADAWLEVRQAIRKEGYMGEFKSDNPAAVKAVAAITWQTLCNMTTSEVPALQAQFRRLYEEFAGQEEKVLALESRAPKAISHD